MRDARINFTVLITFRGGTSWWKSRAGLDSSSKPTVKHPLQLWAEFLNNVDASRYTHGNVSISYPVCEGIVASRIPIHHEHGTCINTGEARHVDLVMATKVVGHQGS